MAIVVLLVTSYLYITKTNKNKGNDLCDVNMILSNIETNHNYNLKKLSDECYCLIDHEENNKVDESFGYLYYKLIINLEDLGQVESLWESFVEFNYSDENLQVSEVINTSPVIFCKDSSLINIEMMSSYAHINDGLINLYSTFSYNSKLYTIKKVLEVDLLELIN